MEDRECVRIRTNNGWPIWRQLGVKRVCHIYCHISGHIKKETHKSAGHLGHKMSDMCQTCMSDMHVDSSLKKKIEKSANQQARIPHFGKSGTPY